MTRPLILILDWLPDGTIDRWRAEFADFEFLDARQGEVFDVQAARMVIAYGIPPLSRLADAPLLRWIQLLSAGVPPELCQPGAQRGIVVTNLSDLYGAVIAEHALAMMLMLSRNLHLVVRNQQEQRWDKGAVAQTMSDLHGKTAAIIGAGNIGQEIARLGRALGMRIVGCRRTDEPAAYLDRLYPPSQLGELLGEADYVIVAAPLTRQTEGMLGRAEFAAMKRGVFFINVSRGAIADEAALLAALRSGHVAGAGLDAFAVEPLPVGHPFWSLPQVIVSPHYSGETVNLGPLPGERFARNLRCWQAGKKLEGMVDLQLGY